MNLVKLAILVLTVLFTANSNPETQVLCDGIMEENDLWISASLHATQGVQEQNYHEILDRIESIYTPIIAEKYSAKLRVIRSWNNGKVNAVATRRGGFWNIEMFGGMARHRAMTEDAFAMVACHEIGHHIGGAPKKSRGWAKSEGQADYWTNLKCMHRYLEGMDHESFLKDKEVPELVQQLCTETYGEENAQLVCIRMSLAGKNLADVFRAAKKERRVPRFHTPYKGRVQKSKDGHPKAQCRLDTFFNAALCPVDPNIDVSGRFPEVGTCMNPNEYGSRPTCWYAYKN